MPDDSKTNPENKQTNQGVAPPENQVAKPGTVQAIPVAQGTTQQVPPVIPSAQPVPPEAKQPKKDWGIFFKEEGLKVILGIIPTTIGFFLALFLNDKIDEKKEISQYVSMMKTIHFDVIKNKELLLKHSRTYGTVDSVYEIYTDRVNSLKRQGGDNLGRISNEEVVLVKHFKNLPNFKYGYENQVLNDKIFINHAQRQLLSDIFDSNELLHEVELFEPNIIFSQDDSGSVVLDTLALKKMRNKISKTNYLLGKVADVTDMTIKDIE